MSTIIDIDLETGDLTQFTSTQTDGGNLSVSAGAALASTSYGMSLLINDTNAIYGTKTITANFSGVVRLRFYLDPNNLTMANANRFNLVSLNTGGGSYFASVQMYYTSSKKWQVRGELVSDVPASINTSDYQISDAPHYIEVQVRRATNSTSADGSLQLWIDGVSQQTVTGDNFDRFAGFATLQIGAVAGIDAGTSGTFYIDQIKANDDGSEIGAHVALRDLVLVVDPGAFTLTGEAANLEYGRRFALDPGSFTLTGQAAGLRAARKLTLEPGVYTLAGQDIDLVYTRLGNNYVLEVDPGAFTLTGQAVGLRYTRILHLDPGAYTLTGQDIDLIYAHALAHYTLEVDPGAFTLTGEAANLEYGRRFALDPGTFTLTGQASTLKYGRGMIASPGAFTLTGQAVGLRAARKLTLESGAFHLTGQAANLEYGRILHLDPGAFTLTGQAAGLRYGRRLVVAPGAYTLAGQALIFHYGRRLVVAPGAYLLAGQEVTLYYSGAFPPASDDRVYLVRPEIRLWVIDPENRVALVEPENRQIRIRE